MTVGARRLLRNLVLPAAASALLSSCASRPPAAPASHPVPPEEAKAGWSEEGLASWYGGSDGFEGKPTASGEIYDSSQLTAAHRDLPLGTVVDVTCVDNGKRVRVRINDRGPFVQGRIIDLSHAAAERIEMIGPGVALVRLTVVSPGAPVAAASPTGRWTVQVGSFADKEHARRQAERLQSRGYAVFFEPYDGLTRVKVGPVDSRDRAAATLADLEAAGFEGIVVPVP